MPSLTPKPLIREFKKFFPFDDNSFSKSSMKKMTNKGPSEKERNIFSVLCSKGPIVVIFSILFIITLISRSYHRQIFENRGNQLIKPTISSGCKSTACFTLIERLVNYCSLKVAIGAEGPHFIEHEKFILEYVLLTIRHGDRSSIHKMPGSIDNGIANPDNPFYDSRALQYIPRSSSFSIVPIESRNVKSTLSNPLPNALTPDSLFATSDRQLSQGQLTSQGFMQHISLGISLSQSYEEFVSRILSKADIYIRSTNYNRTIQVIFSQ